MKESKGASRHGAMPAATPNIVSSSISAAKVIPIRATAANGSRSKVQAVLTCTSPMRSADRGSSTSSCLAFGSSRIAQDCKLPLGWYCREPLTPNQVGIITTILTGASLHRGWRWQELQIVNLPRLLTRQLHLLRVQYGPRVDDREAYLDAVLLNVYGGPGVTNIWIDDLQRCRTRGRGRGRSAGRAAPEPVCRNCLSGRQGNALPSCPSGFHRFSRRPRDRPRTCRRWALSRRASQDDRRHTVKLVGSELRVDSRPMFPRVIQHRGEPLAVLEADRVQRRLAATFARAGTVGGGRPFGAMADLSATSRADADCRNRPGIRFRLGLGLGQ